MAAITAKFVADISDFRAKLAQMKTETVNFGASTTAVSNQLKKFTNEFSGAKLIREAETMARAIDGIGGVTKLTEAQQLRLIATVKEANEQYRALGINAPDNIKKITKELEGTVAAQKKASEEIARAQQQFAQDLRGVGAGLTSAGTVLTAAISVPVIAGFGLSIKAAKDFESAFADVVKTVDGFDVDNFGKLNEDAKAFSLEIRNLAKEIPVTATELSKIASIGGQFGVSRGALLD